MLTVIRSSTLAALHTEIATLSADNARLRDLMTRLTAASVTLLECVRASEEQSTTCVILPPQGGMIA